MTIEELVEFREILEYELLPPDDEDRKGCLHCDAIEVAIGLINSEIERQSVTDEDMQSAIDLLDNVGLFSVDDKVIPYPQKEHDAIRKALEVYRRPEPCEFCEKDSPFLEKYQREEYEHCPNCGRKLEVEK